MSVSSRLFIDEEYTNGTYPTPDCNFVNFVLSVVRTFLSYQHNSRRRYCTAGADTKKKNRSLLLLVSSNYSSTRPTHPGSHTTIKIYHHLYLLLLLAPLILLAPTTIKKQEVSPTAQQATATTMFCRPPTRTPDCPRVILSRPVPRATAQPASATTPYGQTSQGRSNSTWRSR